VAVPAAFSQIYASSGPVTLTANVDDDPTSQGVVWTLSLANTSCSPGCGTLKQSTTNPRFSIVYTPPTVPPGNTTATITASSAADNAAAFAFNFTILPAISVSIANKFTTQKSGDPQVALNATVTNDLASAGVTWTLTAGGQPCPGAACGTLTAAASPTLTATYTPPATAPADSNTSPTITATSVTDPTKSDSFTFTIVPGITVTISNKFQGQFIGDPPVVINASVVADAANAGVSWTLLNANGLACSNCGTLVASPSPSFSATYTPPPTQPIGADSNPTITATSVTNPTKIDSFGFAISISPRPFAGTYAFLLRGFSDLTTAPSPMPNLPMAMAGSFTLDAQGNVTGGDLDINNSGGITSVSSLTGNFIPDSSFNGIIRGTVTITNVIFPGTSTPFPLSFKFVLSSDYTHGRILELDGALFVNIGTIQRQDPSALAAANPAGTYAFGVDSDSPLGGRTVEAGQLILTSSGVSGGLIDESKAGDATPRYVKVPLAVSTLTPPDASGRGTLTLTVNASGVPASSDHYAYYILNSGQLNLIQMDAAPTFGTVFAGVARAQKPLTPTSVNTISVLQLTGMDTVPPATNGQPGPDVIIGVMQIPNPNGATGTYALTFDENDLGKILTSHSASGLVPTFDPATGRGELSAPLSGFGVGFMDEAVFYLYDTGAGFVIDDDISTCANTTNCTPPNNHPITNNAFSGTLTPQATGVQFDNNSLLGNVIFASGGTAIPNIPSVLAGMNFVLDNSAIPPTTYTAKGDLSSLSSQDGNLPNVTFSGTYSVFAASPGSPPGHGLLRLPEQTFGVLPGINQLDSASFYLIGPNQGVAIGVQQGANSQPGPYSGVMFFDPE